ncbi:ribonuclease Oy-like [Paramacrobiotus metropolitanus]|uniref:ribonuclease Oy-like n=1 Tax=Paramacrobiotus metropolitanus TaxID=2943436 RepID=UPI002445B29E|nr:ribonuclease Oy-like [Paramacrobiotus metropolitanus]
MRTIAVYFLTFIAMCSMDGFQSRKIASNDRAKNAQNDDFDFLLFAQQWPASACVDGHFTASATCGFPPGLSQTGWTVHGLWPSKIKSMGPDTCSRTAFKADILKPLMQDLQTVWPNLITSKPDDSFWAHEWTKHGTCAASVPALAGEFNYFNKLLQFYKQYNLYNALQAANIVPSVSKTYTQDAVMAALRKGFNKQVGVHCAYRKDTQQHYLAEIRLCLTKDLTLMDCPQDIMRRETASCPKNGRLLYPPLPPSASRTSNRAGGRGRNPRGP